MAHELRIRVLGGFEVALDGRPVADETWRRNRARALVKVLALAPRRQHHREAVMDELWPQLDTEAAAGNLRKAIHFARAAIGAEHVVVRRELVGLAAPQLWIDVEAFETAAAAGDVLTAIELYRGDLLPEDRFEPWTDDVRERLRRRFGSLLLERATGLEREGRFEAAVELLARLVAHDPLHEDGHLALVRTLALTGARHRAIACYRQFEARLRDELAVEPGPAIRQLHDRIAAGRFPATGVEASAGGVEASAGGAEASAGGVAPAPVEEERRLVTVLSAELGAGPDDPEFARRELEAWRRVAEPLAAAFGARIETEPTGGILAMFGTGRAREDDLDRALRAGLELVRLMPGSRVGLAIGPVLATGGGRDAPRPGRVYGAVMAEATSLRARAEPGSILVSSRARGAAGQEFVFADGAAPLGFGGDRHIPSRLLAAGAASTGTTEEPLIGREAELASLVAAFDGTVAERRPRLVVLQGSAGIGKSRLAQALVDELRDRRVEATILRARCLPGDRAGPLDALGELLRDACGIAADGSAKQARDRLTSAVRRALGRASAIEADVAGAADSGAAEVEGANAEANATTFALATSAGIGLPGNPLDGLQPADVAARLGVAWPRFLSALAVEHPVVVALEDLHWATTALLDIVEQIVTRSTGSLLVLATARPELYDVQPAFGTASEATRLPLRPLRAEHSRQFVDRLAGDRLDDRARSDVLARAEGNPFYLEQLVHHLTAGTAGGVPDTLQTLLASRLDSLPGAERRILQEAAVVGRVFWEAPLRRALGDEHIGARLAALERKGFVVRRPGSALPGQVEYQINHALLHDVAYDSLPRARRARAHAAVAAWLEDLVGDRVDEVVDALATHYWRALAPDTPGIAGEDGGVREPIRRKAFGYLVRAGDAARRRFLVERAIDLHERALAIAARTADRIIALEALGEDHATQFHGDAAAERYRAALALTRREKALTAVRARVCRELAWLLAWNPGGFRSSPDGADADALIDEGLAVVDDERERAWLLLARGTAARLYRGSEPLGQGTQADPWPIGDRVAVVEEARATAERLGDDELAAAAGQSLGLLYGVAGRYAEMVAQARREVERLGAYHSHLDRSDTLRKLAIYVINVEADFEEGLALGRACRRELDAAGSVGPHQLMHALWPILAALFQLGRWDELRGPLDEHVAAFRKEPATECQSVRDGPVIGAAALFRLGQTGEAAAMAGLLGDPLADLPSASAWQARYATISGDPATAITISSGKAREGRLYGPQHAFALLEALAAAGDLRAAADFLPAARGAIPGNALLVPLIDRIEGLIELDAGRPTRAATLLRRSASTFDRHKVPIEASVSRALLDGVTLRAGA